MGRQREYQRLMEQIRQAHRAFAKAWTEARTVALKDASVGGGDRAWEQVWKANGVAYKVAQPLSDARDGFLGTLFRGHLNPLQKDLIAGKPDAVSAVIDFLEVDIPAFRCGYAKEYYLRVLKSIPLTSDHQERIRQYVLRLCGLPDHRREIAEAGRLVIRVADRDFLDQLRVLTMSDNAWIRKKSLKMLRVVQNGRKDLR